MKEHPILFSTPMVRAILEGRKTQTRRVIQPQPEIIIRPIDDKCNEVIWSDAKRVLSIGGGGDVFGACVRELSPYGYRGDRLWVRETWLQDGEIYLYKADFGKGILSDSWNGHWKPSIHMPRKASRLMLEIVNIRAERLQDISEEDARAEGVVWQRDFGNGPETREARPVFFDVWDAINGNRDEGAYTVKKNPWVWVIEFKEVK